MLKAALKTVAISAFAVTILTAGATISQAAKRPGVTGPAQKEAAGPKTVFDMAHAEIFSPVETGPLNYSAFFEGFRTFGENVALNAVKITPESLKGVKTFVFAGPSREVWPSEIDALKAFVNEGGNLLVLLHISKPVARLTEPFGIVVSNFVVSESDGVIKGRSQDFFVSRLSKHPLTEGVKRLAVFGTWGLLTEKGAVTVASTSEGAWADLDRNRAKDPNEPVQSFGIVGVSGFGKGKVVVVADDAPFANRFINEADNKRFAENIIRWFK